MKLIKCCILFFAFLFLESCSTEKNKVLNREFHNLHAKYNGFFNANEIIKVTYNDFLKTRKENYNLILPIFPLPMDMLVYIVIIMEYGRRDGTI